MANAGQAYPGSIRTAERYLHAATEFFCAVPQ